MSHRKTGEQITLKMSQLKINLEAMKPGAQNPLTKRRETQAMIKRNQSRFQSSTENLKKGDHHQTTHNTKLRKSITKSPNRSPNRSPNVNKPATYFKMRLTKPLNPVAITAISTSKPPPTPPPPMDLSPTNSNDTETSASLMDTNNMIPTPFGLDNSDIDIPTPLPPPTPTPPPPPPPNHIKMRSNGGFDVLTVPPAPPPPVLTSITKAPRDTAHSTTFTISGQKITVIGHARTGKTSLKNALFGRKFEDMTFPTVKAPLRASILVKPLRLKGSGNDVEDISVAYEVWDTPGQKVLEDIPPLYITGSFCVLVVYDITDRYSYERAQYWINYLEEIAKGYENVVLIGNKYDLEKDRFVESDEVHRYAQKHDIFFIEISVKTKYNFDVLFAWLNNKTQDKFMRDMELMEEEIVYDEWSLCNEDVLDNDEEKQDLNKQKQKQKHKKKKKGRKEWLKLHQRHRKPIELDKIDVHSRKGRGCCLW